MTGRSARTLRAASGCAAIAFIALAPPAVGAQCDASVKPAPGEVGYKKRPYACEGMYIGLQSAPVGVQVVSLVRGTLGYRTEGESDSVLFVKTRHNVSKLEPQVRVIGRARKANLHWALDGVVPVSNPLRWDLGTVVKPMKLDSTLIGIYGLARRRVVEGGVGSPVFVPLEVTRSEHPANTASVELIVRIPAAAALCWTVRGGRNVPPLPSTPGCEPSVPPIDGNADGYFKIVIPPQAEGEHQVLIRWRPRGAHVFSDPVPLSVHFW